MTKVSPTAPSTSIFSYYGYTNGQISSTPLTTPLSLERSARTVQVNVAFTAAPPSTPGQRKRRARASRARALLRLTPPSYSAERGEPAMPVRSAAKRAGVHDDRDGDRHAR